VSEPSVTLSDTIGTPQGGHGESEFNNPSALAVDHAGNLIVADTGNHRIVKLDAQGRFLWSLGGSDADGLPRQGTAQGEFYSPQAVTTDPETNIYVADTRNCRVQKFSSDGDFLTIFGSWGRSQGQFGGDGPLGIALDEHGRVLVSDSHTADGGNHRVQTFTSEGDYLDVFGNYGTGLDQFAGSVPIRQYGFDHGPGIGPGPIGPAGIVVNTQRSHLLNQNVAGAAIYAADCDNDRVIAFRGRGSDPSQLGTGLIFRPRQVALDSAGRLYVSGVHMHEPAGAFQDLDVPGKWRIEPNPRWVFVLSAGGDLLGKIGLTETHDLMEHHHGAGLHVHGYGLAVSPVDDGTVYVQGGNLIFKYRVEW
jgi:DNA-binding beta-propeller fold protein YncE